MPHLSAYRSLLSTSSFNRLHALQAAGGTFGKRELSDRLTAFRKFLGVWLHWFCVECEDKATAGVRVVELDTAERETHLSDVEISSKIIQGVSTKVTQELDSQLRKIHSKISNIEEAQEKYESIVSHLDRNIQEMTSNLEKRVNTNEEKLGRAMDDNVREMSKVTEKLEEVPMRVQSSLMGKAEARGSKGNEEGPPSFSDILRSAMEEQKREEEAKERRDCNLMIFRAA